MQQPQWEVLHCELVLCCIFIDDAILCARRRLGTDSLGCAACILLMYTHKLADVYAQAG